MPSPFPGMDPYLEDPYIFPDFQHAFAAELRTALNRSLPGPYYARVEMRPEVGIVDDGDSLAATRIIPDVLVLREPIRPSRGPAGGAVVAELPRAAGARTELSPWIAFGRIEEPMARHYFVEIRDSTRDHKLVTLVEILSPSNKRPGADRRAYQAKQAEVLQSDVNLIEIDLLRTGRRILPNAHLDDAIHRHKPSPACIVLVSRAWERDALSLGYIVFFFGLRDLLPCIPIPLKEGQAELPLDLQAVFLAAYDAGPYRRGAVDYEIPPVPPLSGEDAAWAAELLRA